LIESNAQKSWKKRPSLTTSTNLQNHSTNYFFDQFVLHPYFSSI